MKLLSSESESVEFWNSGPGTTDLWGWKDEKGEEMDVGVLIICLSPIRISFIPSFSLVLLTSAWWNVAVSL